MALSCSDCSLTSHWHFHFLLVHTEPTEAQTRVRTLFHRLVGCSSSLLLCPRPLPRSQDTDWSTSGHSPDSSVILWGNVQCFSVAFWRHCLTLVKIQHKTWQHLFCVPGKLDDSSRISQKTGWFTVGSSLEQSAITAIREISRVL